MDPPRSKLDQMVTDTLLSDLSLPDDPFIGDEDVDQFDCSSEDVSLTANQQLACDAQVNRAQSAKETDETTGQQQSLLPTEERTPAVEESGNQSERPKNWHNKPYSLPPCRVCGAKGTGFHYGVNTCEPCKTFFRRASAKGRKSMKCKRSRKCSIESAQHKGSLCAYCRYQKCLESGMSVDGIRFGRYSFNKIMSDTREVKLRKADDVIAGHKSRDSPRAEEIRSLTTTIVEGAKKHLWPLYRDHSRFTSEIHSFFEEHPEIKKTFFQDMSEVTPEERQRVEFYNRALSHIEKFVQFTVKFAKCIPGFRKLPIDDQIALFKGGFPDLRVLSIYPFLDVERKLVANKFSIHLVMGEDFGNRAILVAKRLQMLQLTSEELALLSALVIFITDRCNYNLVARQQADSIHNEILEAMQRLFENKQDKMIFLKMVAALTEMRSLAVTGQHFFSSTISQVEDRNVVQVPSIMSELLLF